MKITNPLLILMLWGLAGCAMTQKPATVSDSLVNASAAVPVHTEPASQAPAAPARPVVTTSPENLSMDQLTVIAKLRQKNPAGLKHYLGQTLHGQAKFVKTVKGNPNAVVADVQVKGLGEVSLWCRNVVGAAAPNRAADFTGAFTGEVYTSEDFGHDVFLKDCRFRD